MFLSHPRHHTVCVHRKSQIEGEARSVGCPILPGSGAPKLVPNNLIFLACCKSVCPSLAVSLSVPLSESHIFTLNIQAESRRFAW